MCSLVLPSTSQKLELGAGAGVLPYKGDFQPTFNPFVPNPGVSFFARYNIRPGISFKAEGIGGYISGKDSRSSNPLNRLRGNSFKGWLTEANAQIQLNFLDFRSNRALSKYDFTPYLFVGLGTKNIFAGQNELRTDITVEPTADTFEESGMVVPFGVGFKKVWKSNWNLGFDLGARRIGKDNFDRFGYTTDDDGLQVPSLAQSVAAGTTQTKKVTIPNNHLNDMYFYMNFYVSYVFYKVRCPNPR